MEEMEVASEQLREELRRKEAEFEDRLMQVREQQTSKLRYRVFLWFLQKTAFIHPTVPEHITSEQQHHRKRNQSKD